MADYKKKKKIGGSLQQFQESQFLNIDPNMGTIKPTFKTDVVPLKTDVVPLKTDVVPLKTDVDKELDKENNELNEEEQKELLAAQELEAKIEALKKQVEILKGQLSLLKPEIDVMYNKYEEKDEDTKIDQLTDIDKEALEKYINIYKEYVFTLGKIADAENERDTGFFDTFVLDPISKSISKIFDKAKNGIAKLATGSGKFWTDTIARSMEEMEPSLKRIQDAKARIYGTATQGLKGATENINDAATGATENMNAAATAATENMNAAATSLIPAQGGGRYSNIKEVQKGGAAAAKRVETSIKQFLSSSVTSSHILKMVKRKTKAKRKRNEKRYSRKRAKK